MLTAMIHSPGEIHFVRHFSGIVQRTGSIKMDYKQGYVCACLIKLFDCLQIMIQYAIQY